ncbi:GNAT family N-acetyltransferase [Rhizorhapis sp. SPR117]|uniref:GNAT family N-acetyltransferase n=1 Tax=Rhizorhapis sp. SPR117 TaxID=2912611 RepID=UPI001EFFA5DB|nr:GNAT family N-acetyltransferase [Rhizorhapis sp. SPR117]
MTTVDIQVSALEPGDLVQAKGLSDALGWPYRLEDWIFAHGLGEGLALRQGGRLIGTGMRWNYGPSFATVGMIIVDGAFQGRGLGARLVDGLLEGAGDRSVILNATMEGLELYRRRGFVSFGLTCQHQGIAKPVPASDAACRIGFARDADWPALIELDQIAAGMPRRRLLEALAGCGVASVLRGEDGGVRGYAVCREFGRGHVVGPVVAQSADKAAALIAHAMSGLVGRFVRVNTPALSGLGTWLEAHGLLQVDTEEAMVRGTLPEVSAQARIFALCSNSLG